MISRGYQKYLKSPVWINKRAKILNRDNYECQWCGAHGVILQVHHLNYEHIFKERSSDLITLCKKCHPYADKIRKLLKRLPPDKAFQAQRILSRFGYPFDMQRFDSLRRHVKLLWNILQKLEKGTYVDPEEKLKKLNKQEKEMLAKILEKY